MVRGSNTSFQNVIPSVWLNGMENGKVKTLKKTKVTKRILFSSVPLAASDEHLMEQLPLDAVNSCRTALHSILYKASGLNKQANQPTNSVSKKWKEFPTLEFSFSNWNSLRGKSRSKQKLREFDHCQRDYFFVLLFWCNGWRAQSCKIFPFPSEFGWVENNFAPTPCTLPSKKTLE